MQDNTTPAISLTREIPLTQGKVAIVDAEDYERVSAFRWHATRSSTRNAWYASRNTQVNHKNTKLRMHRFIMEAPDAMDVDHRDGDGLNNQRSNLRIATQSQNHANQETRPGRNKTGFKGVRHRAGTRHSLRFEAVVFKDGRGVYAGVYATAIEAARAYDAKATELHGEFARPNFPRETD